MKLKHGINILFFVATWYAGFYFWDLDDTLLDQFFKGGWEDYNGPDLDSPENAYFKILMAITAYSFWCSIQTAQKYKVYRLGLIGAVVAACTFITAFVLWWADGDYNIRETKYIWQFCCVANIAISFVVIVKRRKGKKVIPMHHDILDDPNSIINGDI